VAPRAVDGDSQHLRLERFEFFEQFVVQRELVTAHRAPVEGIEHEYYIAAAEIRQ
jgi:hypothetical protein